MAKVVTILSGGMDSATLAYYNADHDLEQIFLTFNYGQRHVREILSAAKVASSLGCAHFVINVADLGKHLSSALIGTKKPIPEGHYAQENMSQTVVPNRNAIMLSMAWGVAISEKADVVFYGAHAGDHAIYPDCRMSFVKALESAFRVGTEALIRIEVPFISLTKAGILQKGLLLKVPYGNTWTCYNGQNKACGRCGCCVERLQAFDVVGAVDPLEYADRNYLKKAVKEFQEKGA